MVIGAPVDAPVYDLSRAEVLLPFPEPLALALTRIAMQSATYPPHAGSAPARTMVAAFLAGQWRTPVDPETVTITGGATLAMAATLLAVTSAGDAVLLPTPCYPNIKRVVLALDRKVIDYDGTGPGGLTDPAALIATGARAVVIVNPHNPMGWIAPQPTLAALVLAAAASGITIIQDAAFQEFIWTGAPLLPLPAGPNTVTLGSFGKALGNPNLRAGWAFCDPAIGQLIAQRHWALAISCSSMFAGLAALAIDATDRIADVRAEARKRMESAIGGALAGGLSIELPPAGCCFWLDLGDTDADTFVSTVRREQAVIIRSASFFGASGAHSIRAALAEDAAKTYEGFRRLALAIRAADG